MVEKLERARDGRAIGATVTLEGPMGLRRRARTRIERVVPGRLVEGVAEVGPATAARVCWRLEPVDEGCHVALEAEILRASSPDRALLALGGRAWLRRRFALTLARLAAAVAEPRARAA